MSVFDQLTTKTPEELEELWKSPQVMDFVKKSRGQFVVLMGHSYEENGNFQMMTMVPDGFIAGIMPYVLRELLGKFLLICHDLKDQDVRIVQQKMFYQSLMQQVDLYIAPLPAKKEMN